MTTPAKLTPAQRAEYDADHRPLYELAERDFELGGYFDRVARAYGHCSGRSAADELNLWDLTVADAVNTVELLPNHAP